MTDITLTYFDASSGRGEDCRLALHLAGVPFTDDRIDRVRWAALKPESPFGGLPTLSVDGKVIGQSNAILTWIGRRFGLHPTDLLEAARHEAVMAAVEDLRAALRPVIAVPEPGRKEARETYANGPLQDWAARIARQIVGPFVGGATANVADLKLYVMIRAFRIGTYDHIPSTIFDRHPELVALCDAVAALPEVRDWSSRH